MGQGWGGEPLGTPKSAKWGEFGCDADGEMIQIVALRKIEFHEYGAKEWLVGWGRELGAVDLIEGLDDLGGALDTR